MTVYRILIRHGLFTPAPPRPASPADGAIEVDRTVNRSGHVGLGRHTVLAAKILAGRRVGIRIDRNVSAFFDLDTRLLLSPTQPADRRRNHPAPRRPTGRTATATINRTDAGAASRLQYRHRHGRRPNRRPRSRPRRKTATINATDAPTSPASLAVECDDGVRTIRRTNQHRIRNVKANRPRATHPAGWSA